MAQRLKNKCRRQQHSIYMEELTRLTLLVVPVEDKIESELCVWLSFRSSWRFCFTGFTTSFLRDFWYLSCVEKIIAGEEGPTNRHPERNPLLNSATHLLPVPYYLSICTSTDIMITYLLTYAIQCYDMPCCQYMQTVRVLCPCGGTCWV